MPFVLPWWVTAAVTLAVAVLAFVRGGRLERLVAALALANAVWNRVGGYVYGADLPRELAHDAAAAALMTVIALRANRYWIVGAAAAWLVSAETVVARMASPVNGWTFGTAQLVWYYVFLACLAAGSWRTPAHAAKAPRLSVF